VDARIVGPDQPNRHSNDNENKDKRSVLFHQGSVTSRFTQMPAEGWRDRL
jgi:hypothetical protein